MIYVVFNTAKYRVSLAAVSVPAKWEQGMLSDMQVRKAAAKDKDYKLTDEKGMYLLVAKTGSKYWRLNYSYGQKRKTLAIGVYPEVSLKEAREKRDAAKALL